VWVIGTIPICFGPVEIGFVSEISLFFPRGLRPGQCSGFAWRAGRLVAVIRACGDFHGMRRSGTGDYIFENEWQSFRTKKDRSLELTSVFHECSPGRRKLAVKLVDIFGNDTMTIVEVAVGGRK
jgi:hypothetical protein